MSPLICPQPGPPTSSGADCPLYARRLLETQREARLSAAIQRELPAVPSLAALIHAEAARPTTTPPTARLTRPELPKPEPVIAPVLQPWKGATHE